MTTTKHEIMALFFLDVIRGMNVSEELRRRVSQDGLGGSAEDFYSRVNSPGHPIRDGLILMTHGLLTPASTSLVDAEGVFHCRCGKTHKRGPLNGVASYRCMGCGEVTTLSVSKPAKDSPEELRQLRRMISELAAVEWQGKDVTTKRLIFEARRHQGWSDKEISK